MKKYGFVFLGLFCFSLMLLQACKIPPPITPAPMKTPTPTPMPTSCLSYGSPASLPIATTVPMNLNDYVAYSNAFSYGTAPNQTVAQTFDNFSFYAVNGSGSLPATFELAVFNQSGASVTTQQVLADTTYVLAPSASGWFTANLSGAVTDAGAVNLVAHALSPGLSIGTVTYSYPAAGSVSGNYVGHPLPVSLALTPTWTTTGFAINVNWCSRTLTNGY